MATGPLMQFSTEGEPLYYLLGDLVWADEDGCEDRHKWTGWAQHLAAVVNKRAKELAALHVYHAWASSTSTEEKRALHTLMQKVSCTEEALDPVYLAASEYFMYWMASFYRNPLVCLPPTDRVVCLLDRVFYDLYCEDYEVFIRPVRKRMERPRPRIPDYLPRRFARLYERVMVSGGDYGKALMFRLPPDRTPHSVHVAVNQDGLLCMLPCAAMFSADRPQFDERAPE